MLTDFSDQRIELFVCGERNDENFRRRNDRWKREDLERRVKKVSNPVTREKKKRRLSNGVSGLTYTTLDILLTTPETVLKEYVQYASEAERRFDDVRGVFANCGKVRQVGTPHRAHGLRLQDDNNAHLTV